MAKHVLFKKKNENSSLRLDYTRLEGRLTSEVGLLRGLKELGLTHNHFNSFGTSQLKLTLVSKSTFERSGGGSSYCVAELDKDRKAGSLRQQIEWIHSFGTRTLERAFLVGLDLNDLSGSLPSAWPSQLTNLW